jgi:hypothetical protein
LFFEEIDFFTFLKGFKIKKVEDFQRQKDHVMRSQCKDPIAQLPDKVEELLVALRKVIIEVLLLFYLFILF